MLIGVTHLFLNVLNRKLTDEITKCSNSIAFTVVYDFGIDGYIIRNRSDPFTILHLMGRPYA